MNKTLSYYLDIQSLARLARNKRGNKGLRAIAQECCISASTLSRVEREQVPDISSFIALCDWLELSPARLFKHSADQQQGERSPDDEFDELTLSKADALALRVRADSRLDPATANVLAVLIKAAYKISAEISD